MIDYESRALEQLKLILASIIIDMLTCTSLRATYLPTVPILEGQSLFLEPNFLLSHFFLTFIVPLFHASKMSQILHF